METGTYVKQLENQIYYLVKLSPDGLPKCKTCDQAARHYKEIDFIDDEGRCLECFEVEFFDPCIYVREKIKVGRK